ncbi:MAG: hypothetical protein ABSD38_17730 [Syntrophorhabdales bacterium]|jgi:hypothetical protein
MKRLIVLSLLTAVTFLTWGSVAPAHAQDSAKDDKPTFYHLVPGTYVNPWPRFTVTYPKEWTAERFAVAGGQVFLVSPPGPGPHPSLGVTIAPFPHPLDRFPEANLAVFKALGYTDVTVVTDKPSHLQDGTPAWEVELHYIANGKPVNTLFLATKKGDDVIVHVEVTSRSGKVGEDLRAIPYSLRFQPEKDVAIKVPPDVQEFLDKHNNDLVGHDLAKVMAHYSDRYLNSGNKKREVERMWGFVINRITAAEVGVTELVPEGDKAYLAGFGRNNLGTGMVEDTIIKENGEWKWYGNQREVVP